MGAGILTPSLTIPNPRSLLLVIVFGVFRPAPARV